MSRFAWLPCQFLFGAKRGAHALRSTFRPLGLVRGKRLRAYAHKQNGHDGLRAPDLVHAVRVQATRSRLFLRQWQRRGGTLLESHSDRICRNGLLHLWFLLFAIISLLTFCHGRTPRFYLAARQNIRGADLVFLTI